MKKYLVPLLVLVLLMVSVVTVFADRPPPGYAGKLNIQGVCTFHYQIKSCGETFDFDRLSDWGSFCMTDVNITEKSTRLPYTPIQDSVWRCRVKGEYWCDTDLPWCWPELKEVLLIEDITPPEQ